MNQSNRSDMEQKVISASSDSHDSVGQSVNEHQAPVPHCASNGSVVGEPDSPVQVDLFYKEGADGTEIPVRDPKTDKYPKKGGRISKKQEEAEKYLVKNLFEKLTLLEIICMTGINEKKLMKYYHEFLDEFKKVPDINHNSCYCKNLPEMLKKISKDLFNEKTAIKIEYKDEIFTLTRIKVKNDSNHNYH
jgi:hypothetical protein